MHWIALLPPEGQQTFWSWRALQFTLKYTVFITPLLMGLGFALALLTAPNRPVRQITRAIIFMPPL